ncbi:MAG: hypothetical protein L6Q54_04110 [Leptospiraceae bacterium]|nr:hypothetical protein [Leptospiraceae bacterium]MCK6380419.1 hypothetical protein [Leptospiraceae bacterium]NUM41185.1 hypothetical protein [Leptospiraceae bacterium]
MAKLKFLFFLFFLVLFTYQYAIDNDSICGGKGINEDFCSFAYLDNVETNHKDSDHRHTCVNCPCSSILISNWGMDEAKIITEIQSSYNVNLFSKTYNFLYISYLNRPPKNTLS